jgi:hypothetical protein
MATTYVAIASATVGSGGAAYIEFTGIPQTYTDLILFTSLRSTNGGSTDDVQMQPNSAAPSAGRRLYGESTSVGTNFDGYPIRSDSAGATSSAFGNSFTYIPNYTGSASKAIISDTVTENNSTAQYSVGTQMSSVNYNVTTGITSLKIDPDYGATLVQFSTATLYGISNT